jgi:hypothetical protein
MGKGWRHTSDTLIDLHCIFIARTKRRFLEGALDPEVKSGSGISE